MWTHNQWGWSEVHAVIVAIRLIRINKKLLHVLSWKCTIYKISLRKMNYTVLCVEWPPNLSQVSAWSIFSTHLKPSLNKHRALSMDYIAAHDFIDTVLLPIHGHMIELVSIATWGFLEHQKLLPITMHSLFLNC